MTANDNTALAHRQRTGQFAPGRKRCEHCTCRRKVTCPGELVRGGQVVRPRVMGVDWGGPDRTALSAHSLDMRTGQMQARLVDVGLSEAERRVLAHYDNQRLSPEEFRRLHLGEFRPDEPAGLHARTSATNAAASASAAAASAANAVAVSGFVMPTHEPAVRLTNIESTEPDPESMLQQFRDAFPQVQEFWDQLRERIPFARGGTVTGRTNASRPNEAPMPRREQEIPLTYGDMNLGGVVTQEQARRQSRHRFMGMDVVESEHVPPGEIMVHVQGGEDIQALVASPEMAERIRQAVAEATGSVADRAARDTMGGPPQHDNCPATLPKQEAKPAEVAPRRPRRVYDPDDIDIPYK